MHVFLLNQEANRVKNMRNRTIRICLHSDADMNRHYKDDGIFFYSLDSFYIRSQPEEVVLQNKTETGIV